MSQYEAAIATLVRWKTDPVAFVRENFGVEPDEWQLEVLGEFARTQRIAMIAAKGCGKTTVEAWCILNFLSTRPHANIACTSVSGDNLRDGLWKELAKWLGQSAFLSANFDWQKERIVSKTHPATWWAAARTWAKSADAQQQSETLAGLHSDYVLFVLDEAGAIPQAVAVTAEAALASGIETKLLIGGNPTTLDGPLYTAAVTQRYLWHVVRVTGDPDDPKRSPRIDLEWAKQQIAAYSRSSPWVMVNVLGLFPPASLNSLLGPEEVEAAMRRHLHEHEYKWAQKRIGVDVARYGDDRTVLFPRQGLASFRPRVMRHERGSAVSTDIAAAVMASKAKWGSEVEIFDATGGFAAGAVDVLQASGAAPVSMQFHSPADDARYVNRRAEMWFRMAEWVRKGGALPPIPELTGELTAPTYTFVNGKFQLEAKDQVKQRLGRSPDLADALALTFALQDLPAASAMDVMRRGSVGHALTEFDPFDFERRWLQ